NRLRRRENMLKRTTESWRPPLLPMRARPMAGLIDTARRFIDLQAGSIWADLAAELPAVSGNVLDVGCGAQPYRSLLGPQAIYRGIDTADARAHFGYEMPETIYFTG